MNNDFEILGFDTPSPKNGKHHEKTNELSTLEFEEYNREVYEKYDENFNPFNLEYEVILDITASKRYENAINLKEDTIAKVSLILNKNYVNIAYWDSYPNVIKNVPVTHLTLYKKSPIKHKLRVFITKLFRKIFRI